MFWILAAIALNDLYEYDVQKAAWINLTAYYGNSPTRFCFGFTGVGDLLYIFGGEQNGKQIFSVSRYLSKQILLPNDARVSRSLSAECRLCTSR